MKNLITIVLLICYILFSSCDKVNTSTSNAGTATNGSLTKFITVGNYLYVVDNFNLKSYDITLPQMPVLKSTTNIGFAIQTIFSYHDKLFIGSANNMYIYSISTPEKPTQLSQVNYFIHGRDPAIATDSVAYSTVQNSFGTGGVLNVFNIKDINTPITVQTIAMQNPYGLGLKDSALFVCEGSFGIKVFSVKNTYAPILRNTVALNETAYDVIVQGNILICYIKGGLCLIDISNIFTPTIITTIKN